MLTIRKNGPNSWVIVGREDAPLDYWELFFLLCTIFKIGTRDFMLMLAEMDGSGFSQGVFSLGSKTFLYCE